MSSETPKRALFDSFAEVGKALSHGSRLEILEQLAQGERSVEDLANRAGLTVANTSQHLRLMQRAGLLDSRREGKHVLYRHSDPSVLQLVAALRRISERKNAAAREVIAGYFRERDALEAVSRKELASRLKSGLVTVLDVRPEDEYAVGHLPRAINIPLRELSRRLSKLPRGREIVAYCRGPYCVLAFEAVALLRERGWKARRLEDGFPEWKAAGLPVVESVAR